MKQTENMKTWTV